MEIKSKVRLDTSLLSETEAACTPSSVPNSDDATCLIVVLEVVGDLWIRELIGLVVLLVVVDGVVVVVDGVVGVNAVVVVEEDESRREVVAAAERTWNFMVVSVSVVLLFQLV